jgi:hypothetical protein
MTHRKAGAARPVRIYEGALLFATDICFNYMDYLYKRELGRKSDRRPSSKPGQELAERPPPEDRHHVRRGLCTYEGSLSFVTVIYFSIWSIHTNETGGGAMTEGPRLSGALRSASRLLASRLGEVR